MWWTEPTWDGLVGEVGQAARALLRRPGSSLLVVAVLALGIGAATCVFTVVRSVLLRPLPFPEPEKLVVVREVHEGRERAASPAGYLDWRRELAALDELAAVDAGTVTLWEGERPVRVPAATVSGNFFRTLDVAPALGHGFDPRFLPGTAADREVVLGHALWTERFAAAPAVIGRTVRIGDDALVVVGVMPPGFSFPEGAALWIRSPFEVPPVGSLGAEVTGLRDAWYFDAVGRLRGDVGLEAARAEAAALSAALRRSHPGDAPDGGLVLRPLLDEMVAGSRSLLLILNGAVLLVLVGTCANVAGITLVRTAQRAPEMAVRAALGAVRWRIARPVVVESLLLAAVGGALGVAAAVAGLPGLLALLPGALPRAAEIAPDPTVLLAAILATTAVGVASALLPAVRAARTPPPRAGARASAAGPGRTARGLLAAEVAVSVVLVTSSLLLMRSVAALGRVDPGLQAAGLVTLRLALPGLESRPVAERREAWRDVEALAAGVGGIQEAALGAGDPMGPGPRATLRIHGEDGVVEGPDVLWQPVTPGWTGTLGVRLVAGRTLSAADATGTPDVAVVDEALARAAFGGADPLGRRLTIGLDGHDRPLLVVGVVASIRNRGPDAEPFPVLYRPAAQVERLPGTWTLAARSAAPGDDGASLARLRAALIAARPGLLVVGESRGVELFGGFLAERRFLLRLVGAFGLLSVLLGSMGVYGVAEGTAAARRREIGIRMAIGGSRGSVVGRVLRAGVAPVLSGVGIGLAGAWVAAASLRGLLFGVGPGDPVTAAVVTLGLVAVAVAASAGPAARAAAVDPAETLRDG